MQFNNISYYNQIFLDYISDYDKLDLFFNGDYSKDNVYKKYNRPEK